MSIQPMEHRSYVVMFSNIYAAKKLSLLYIEAGYGLPKEGFKF